MFLLYATATGFTPLPSKEVTEENFADASTAIYSLSLEATPTSTYENKIFKLLEFKVAQYFGSGFIISEIKNLQDFSGNEYIVAETLPVGYMIFHNGSGQIVERSDESISPYYNLYGDLYYAGPTYYYILQDGEYYHTLIDENFDNITEDMINICDSNYEQLSENQNNTALSYLENETLSNYIEIQPFATVTNYEIANSNFFSDMGNSGYIGNNSCMYVAGAMIISYYQLYRFSNNFIQINEHKPFIENYTYAPTQRYSVAWQLTKYLQDIGKNQYGQNNGTDGHGINNVIRYYMENYTSRSNIYCSSPLIFGGSIVMDNIRNNRPVIIAGSLDIPGQGRANHGVVVYKIKKTVNFIITSWECTANFGYAEGDLQVSPMNSVILSGVWGSMCVIEY